MAFEWTDATEDSFVQLRSALTTAPVLAYPRFGPGYTFILETDASTVGLGAVLSQVQEDGMVHPIAYASRAVDKHERNYGISELETLGLVWSVRYFRSYLLGHLCVVYTDHAACLSILNTAKPSGKLARWALTIQEMDLVIKHKSGKKNAAADALSRCYAGEGDVAAVGAKEILPTALHIVEAQRDDPDLLPILSYLEKDELPENEKLASRLIVESQSYDVVDGVLYHKNSEKHCLVVPRELKVAAIEDALLDTWQKRKFLIA